jgi:hypothetical protein
MRLVFLASRNLGIWRGGGSGGSSGGFDSVYRPTLGLVYALFLRLEFYGFCSGLFIYCLLRDLLHDL